MSDLRTKAAASLPPAMRPVFDQLVADYQAAARTHGAGRQPWINYKILADLLRLGWRKEKLAEDLRTDADVLSSLSSLPRRPVHV
jgi:hypothetical protein